MRKLVILLFSALLLLSGCDNLYAEFEVPESDKTEENTESIEKAPEETTENEPQKEEKTPPAKEPILEAPDYVGVSSISLNMYEVSLYPGESRMPFVTMAPDDATDKGEIWESSDAAVAQVNGYGNITGVSVGECVVTVTSRDNPQISASVNVTVKTDAEITYIDGIMIVNKTYPLSKNYAPGNDSEAEHHLALMFSAARGEGIYLKTLCGYRSFIDQQIIYNGYVARDGQASADRYSARPGHSEHQSGLAFDLNSLDQSFGDTPEGKWLAANCYKYGFIIRYPKGKEDVTGYMYEPWHVRYLGEDKAKEVYESGLCLEEFLGITSAYN